MGLFIGPRDEIRLLASYSFLRMVLLVLVGGIINSYFMYHYGFGISQYGSLVYPSDWWVFFVWLAIYPLVWAIGATYALPKKLRASPFDVQLVTVLLLVAVYAYQNPAYWPLLAVYNGLWIVIATLFQVVVVAPIVGLGDAGYDYDSFLVKGKSLSDLRDFYESTQYRNLYKVPDLDIVEQNQRVTLSSSSEDDLRIFVVLSNRKEGLHVQMVSFEKGKYFIFKSEESAFIARELRKKILVQLGTSDEGAIPFVDETEKDMALHIALRPIHSVAALRGLRRRDQFIIYVSSGALLLLLVGTLVFGLKREDAIGWGAVVLLTAATGLSYRRLGIGRLLRRHSQ